MFRQELAERRRGDVEDVRAVFAARGDDVRGGVRAKVGGSARVPREPLVVGVGGWREGAVAEMAEPTTAMGEGEAGLRGGARLRVRVRVRVVGVFEDQGRGLHLDLAAVGDEDEREGGGFGGEVHEAAKSAQGRRPRARGGGVGARGEDRGGGAGRVDATTRDERLGAHGPVRAEPRERVQRRARASDERNLERVRGVSPRQLRQDGVRHRERPNVQTLAPGDARIQTNLANAPVIRVARGRGRHRGRRMTQGPTEMLPRGGLLW